MSDRSFQCLPMIVKDAKEYVCMLTGGMYGNVQAALGFFIEYKDHLMNDMQMEQSLTDPCVFFKKDDQGNLQLMALTHVDDTLIAGNEKESKDFKKGISERFKFRDEGRLKKHLGVTYKCKRFYEKNFLPDKRSLESSRKSNRVLKENKWIQSKSLSGNQRSLGRRKA